MKLLPHTWASSTFSAWISQIGQWAIVVLGMVGNYFFTALSLVVVAHQVTPLAYGQYLAAFSLASFLVVLPSYGLDVWLLAQRTATGQELAQLWQQAMDWRLVFLLGWAIGMALLLLLLPQATYPLGMALVIVVGVGLDSLLALAYAFLRTLGRHTAVTILQAMYGLLLLLTTLVLPLQARGIILFAGARTVLALVLGVGLIAYLWRHYLPDQAKPKRLAWPVLRAARSFLATETISSVYMRADMTIVSLLLGATGARIYGPAINLLTIGCLAPSALFYYFVPILSRLQGQDNARYRQQSLSQLKFQLLIGVGLALVLFGAAPVLVRLIFGPAYLESALILRWLSPIGLLRSANFALAAILIAGQQQAQRAKVQLLCAIFNVVANLIVIVPFGIAGVAAVYVCSELGLCLGYARIVYRSQEQPKL